MTKISWLFAKIILAWVGVLLVFSFTGFFTPASAQTTHSVISKTTVASLVSVSFQKVAVETRSKQFFLNASKNLVAQEEEPTEVQEGKRREWRPPQRIVRKGFWLRVQGLGRRGLCNNLNPPLIALLPPLPSVVDRAGSVLAEGLETGLALTVSAYPTFWFYVPEQLKEIEFAEFMMQDERDEDVFENPIRVQRETSGIVSFQLPSREKPLELNHPYHWYFSIVCDPERPSRNPSIDGWIGRVQLETSRERLAAATPIDRLELYASKDIWHETLKLLAEQLCRSRENPIYAEYWDTILQAVVPDLDRDKIDPLSYCSSQQQLQAVYDSLNIAD